MKIYSIINIKNYTMYQFINVFKSIRIDDLLTIFNHSFKKVFSLNLFFQISGIRYLQKNYLLTIFVIVLVLFATSKSYSQIITENKDVTMELAKKLKRVPKFDQKTGYYIGYNPAIGKSGVYDRNGKEIVPCIYNGIGDLNWIVDYGIIGVQDFNRENVRSFYDVRAQKEIILDYEEMLLLGDAKYRLGDKRAFFSVTKNGKQGIWLADENREIVPCKYDEVVIHPLFSVNYWKVKNNQNGRLGLVQDGKELIPYGKYDNIDVVDEASIARVSLNNKWGLVNLQNGEDYSCKYDAIAQYGEGLCAFKIGDKWGFVDFFGKECIAAKYDKVQAFHDGVAQVIENGSAILITHPINGISSKNSKSSVDINIPVSKMERQETFAFIFAIENYKNINGADYSINDGSIFAEYCKKTLGLPEQNVKYFEDASYGNMVSAIKRIKDITDVYDGKAKVIIYFSGLGFCNSKTSERYLLPMDVSLSSLSSTAINLNSLISDLEQMNALNILAIIDAPFNGTNKLGKNIQESRGVSITPSKLNYNQRVTVWLSNVEDTYSISDLDRKHSLFTYYILEYLQINQGLDSISNWERYVKDKTQKEVLKKYDLIQTPFMYLKNTNNNF